MKKSEYLLLSGFILLVAIFSFIDSDFELSVLLLILGLFFIIFGLKLLLQKGFVERLRKGLWKSEEDERFMSEKESYYIDKYVMGIYAFIMGILMLIFSSIYWFFN